MQEALMKGNLPISGELSNLLNKKAGILPA